MARKRYISSHSNFVLKKKHQTSSAGTIFERDYMTISSLNGFAPGQIPIYGESNFKMTIRNGVNGQLKHRYGNWDKRDGECADYENRTIWTLDCLNNEDISDDSKIVLKPNYTSLLDFAYYGSAVELIRASISDIISKFPAELYLSNRQIRYFKSKDDKKDSILGEDKYVVDNPFDIDVTSMSIANLDVKNKLRYFCESYSDYALYDVNNNKISDIGWVVNYESNSCPQNGDLLATIEITNNIKLYYYYLNGQRILLHDNNDEKNVHIRPNENFVEEFFNKLDDFESLLLNRQSKPLYKAILDTPQEIDTGVVVFKKLYIWPILNDWNLDISSTLYNNYLNNLIKVAQFYDDYYTDNLWRSLTHESIKNLDFTYKKENSDETEEDYVIGTSRLESIFKAYGRQFDDLKRYIDNIKTLNTITYDSKNNLPDYFLSDSLELAGWDIVNVMPTQDTTIFTETLYSGENKGYNAVNANNEFLRRLKLNSNFIFSKKGTKEGIEMLLSLFGLEKYDEKTDKGDFILREYVSVATNGFDKLSDVEKYNKMKNDFIYESSESNVDTDTLQGLPVKMITLVDITTNKEKKYIIPWFDKLQEIDGNPYFQMKGGWGKMFSKEINLEIAPDVTEITENVNVKIYDETSKYLNIVRDLSELKDVSLQKLNNNDIYYVYDITDFGQKYINDKNNPIEENNQSHYFILKDKNYSNVLGYYYENDTDTEYKGEGWVCVKNDGITDKNKLSDDGVRVLYVESIIDENKGNNPHVGFGCYDDGEEYLDYFRKLFKYSIENNNFNENAYNCDDGTLDKEIEKIGFNVESFEDNMKCWYFTDTHNPKYLLNDYNEEELREKKSLIPYQLEARDCEFEGVKINDENYCGYDQILNNDNDVINVGKNFIDSTYTSKLVAVNPESSIGNIEKDYDEAAANSIINTKILKLEFRGDITTECDRDENGNCINGRTFKDYVINKIMPYIKQLIPSTAIFELSIEGENAYYTCFNVATMSAVIDKN